MILMRRSIDSAPGGLLRAEHFQMAYATTDLDAARVLFAERFGIHDFARLGGKMPAGGEIRCDLAWVGPLMYELIEAHGPGAELYMARLPTDGSFALAHHHLGYLVSDVAAFEDAIAQATSNGYAVPYRNANALVEGCFVDVPELGHFIEYLLPTAAGIDFFDAVPRH